MLMETAGQTKAAEQRISAANRRRLQPEVDAVVSKPHIFTAPTMERSRHGRAARTVTSAAKRCWPWRDPRLGPTKEDSYLVKKSAATWKTQVADWRVSFELSKRLEEHQMLSRSGPQSIFSANDWAC